MNIERLRVTLEVWAVRWVGRLRTLARFAATLAVGGAGVDFLLLGASTFGPSGDLALFVAGLVTVLALSVFPRR